MFEKSKDIPRTLDNSQQDSVALQKLVFDVINDKNRNKLQRMINDITVLVFKRIRQLTHMELSYHHTFVTCCTWYELNSDVWRAVRNDTEISKGIIKQKIQSVMDEIEYCLSTKASVFLPAKDDDVIFLEDSVISSVEKGNIPNVTTEEIVSRFLWIVYSHIMNLSNEEMESHSQILTMDTFRGMTIGYIKQNLLPYKVKGYVMDAALLAKSKTERKCNLPLSMDVNGYNISARTIRYIHEHSEISIREIRDTLQQALDMVYYVDKGNGTNQSIIRSRDARWFCSLFNPEKGSVLIETPTLNTPRLILSEYLKHKMIEKGISLDLTFREEELDGKQILCYDGIERMNGDKNVPVFVSRGTVSCQKHGHVLANVTAIVRTVDRSKLVSLPVQKCLVCQPNRFFVSQTLLDNYEKQHGLLYLRRLEDLEKYFLNPHTWLCHSTESLLHKLGYNVSENSGLSSSERQRILLRIIREQQLLKSEIMQHIDMLIRQRQDDWRYRQAVSKWKMDLHFLANLKDTDERYSGYLYR